MHVHICVTEVMIAAQVYDWLTVWGYHYSQCVFGFLEKKKEHFCGICAK